MKITYQRAYSIGPFLQEKIGFERELLEGEDTLTAIAHLKSLCDQAHQQLNPGLPKEVNVSWTQPLDENITVIPTQQVEKTDRQQCIEGILADIDKAHDIKQLEIWKHMPALYPEVRESYNKRLKELS
jgi:hypothetical protein